MEVSLIEFSVENFKIFKNRNTFVMFSRKSKHTFERNKQNLLKTSFVFGPNASGKSSFLNAFSVFKTGLEKSSNNPENIKLPYKPFLLGTGKDKPVFFESIFALGNKIFRYNFSFLEDRVVTENLFEISTTVEKTCFERIDQNIKVFLDFKSSQDVADKKTRKEVLFLSAASQWNNKLAIDIVSGFKNINVISGYDSDSYRNYTINLFRDELKRKKIIEFMKKADFCINDGTLEKVKVPEAIKKQFSLEVDELDTVKFLHNKFKNGKRIGEAVINLADESAGTRRFFDLLGPIIDTLDNGKVLFIDEFDNSLHPFMTQFVVDLFEKKNKKNAQLIATTHDTNLLSNKELNKEQFWFTEKDRFGSAKIFCLAEFKLRNNVGYLENYLDGRFGAVPFITLED